VRRREFIRLFGSAAAAWPLAASAQQAAMPVVGFVSGRWPGESAYLVAAFRRGLREAGFAEGENVAIEYRWGEGDVARAPVLAAELVERGATVIATVGGGMTEVVKSVTTVPVVFIFGADPVRAGLVTGFNRPGGNATGIAILNYALTNRSVAASVVGVGYRPNRLWFYGKSGEILYHYKWGRVERMIAQGKAHPYDRFFYVSWRR
jgi:putative tryptophan/tyrosine transport system substrate-binding protein